MPMEDVCDLELWAAHGRRTTLRFSASLRSAARAGRADWSPFGSWCWQRACKELWCRAWHGRAVMRHNTHPPISLKLKGLLCGIWCYRPW